MTIQLVFRTASKSHHLTIYKICMRGIISTYRFGNLWVLLAHPRKERTPTTPYTYTLMKSLKGFTLIELLIVIVIIGILSTGAVALFTNAQSSARDGVRQSDLNAFVTAMEQYKVRNGGTTPVYAAAAGAESDLTTALTGSAGYLKADLNAPQKATESEVYCYYSDAAAATAGSKYAIVTALETDKYFVAGDLTATDLGLTDAADISPLTACPAAAAGAGVTAGVAL